MEKQLTIIVPVYKIKEAFLRECIDSFINQTSKEFDVILIDDGSPDNCGKICDEYANEHDYIKVIHQKNKGVSEARNNGIANTKTKWLTFVDPDDWITNDAVELICNELNNSAVDCDILMFNYTREYKNESKLEALGQKRGFLNRDELNNCKRAPFHKLIQNGRVNPFSINAIWNKVYKTEFLISKNILFLPDAKMGEDRLLNADAVNSTDNIYYLDENLYHYRCYGDSVTNKFNPNIVHLTKIEIEELKRQVEKHELHVDDFLNVRICTRLYSCVRLYYFNKSNTKRYKDIKNEIIDVIDDEPFREAIKNVKWIMFSLKEKIFIYCVKHHLIAIVKMLVNFYDKKGV